MSDSYHRLYQTLLTTLSDVNEPDDDTILRKIDALVLSDPLSSHLPVRERIALGRRLFAAVRRLDILQPLLDDPSVTEIMVNGPSHIFIERNGVLSKYPVCFRDRKTLEDVVQKIAGRCDRVINERSPIVDARLEDGSRVNAVITPVALEGPYLTIRRFPEEPITMETLVRRKSLSEDAAHMLRLLVRSGHSILISGGTSAGKTTFLNALSAFIPPSERIITIEDNAELQIQGINDLVRLEAKNANMEGAVAISIRDLIRSALRMRPDRIIVGECRGAEAVDMLQALNTGHDGSMSTLHANSASDALHRLETMVLMAFPLPLPAIRAQIASGVDVLIHLSRMPDRSRKVLEIVELLHTCGPDGMPTLHPLYRFDHARDTLVRIEPLRDRSKLERAGLAHEL